MSKINKAAAAFFIHSEMIFILYAKGGEKKLELSEREEMFARNYIKYNFNATKAYAATFPDSSYESAQSNCTRIKQRPQVRERIQELTEEAFKDAYLTPERLALKLRDMCFAEKDDKYYTPNIQLKALELLQKQLGLQKQNIKAEVDNTVTINVGIEE